jgi:hypothetical protein
MDSIVRDGLEEFSSVARADRDPVMAAFEVAVMDLLSRNRAVKYFVATYGSLIASLGITAGSRVTQFNFLTKLQRFLFLEGEMSRRAAISRTVFRRSEHEQPISP